MNSFEKSNIVDCIISPSKNSPNIDDRIVLDIHDIDDLAIAWIFKEENTGDLKEFRIEEKMEEDCKFETVPLKQTMWLWRDGGKHGSGSIDITQWLLNHWEKDINPKDSLYLVIAIYDFPYDHWLFKGGKWSFNATLTKNGHIFWHKHDFGESDIENNKYGLKYLKIFHLKLKNYKDSYKIEFSDIVKYEIHLKIYQKIINDYNYIKFDKKNNKFDKLENNNKDCKQTNNPIFIKSIKLFLKKIRKPLILDIFLLLVGISVLHYFYNIENAIYLFILYNLFALVYSMIRYKFGGRAWALVLRKKHDKELDTFMVILGLLFSAALASISSFDFDSQKMFENSIYAFAIFTLFIGTNIIFLYIMTVIGTYSVNSLRANKPLMLFIISLMGITIFIQELVVFDKHCTEAIQKNDDTKVKQNVFTK